jgi:hypothetical protein
MNFQQFDNTTHINLDAITKVTQTKNRKMNLQLTIYFGSDSLPLQNEQAEQWREKLGLPKLI